MLRPSVSPSTTSSSLWDSVLRSHGCRRNSRTERGTIKIDNFGRLGDTNFFAAGDIVQLGTGQPLMVVNAVGDGKRVAFNLDKVHARRTAASADNRQSTSSSI